MNTSILKDTRDATITLSIQNDGRAAVQVDEGIKQPFRGFSRIKGIPMFKMLRKYETPCCYFCDTGTEREDSRKVVSDRKI